MTTRAEAKAQSRARLLGAARRILAEQGAGAITVREIAREAHVVPSAVYKHFDGRDALITQLVKDGYTDLAEHLESTPLGEVPWRDRTSALRAWARERPHDFALLYGTPVPGYVAPPETIPLAGRVASALLAAVPASARLADDDLDAQLAAPAESAGVLPGTLAWLLGAVAQLVGILLLDAGGHFVGTADPVEPLWRAVVDAQLAGR